MKTCHRVGCNGDMSHRHGSAKYCSNKCKDIARRQSPQYRNYMREYSRKRYANPERRAWMAQYRESNKDKAREYAAEYRSQNMDKFRVYTQDRRARKLSAPTYTFTDSDWRRLVNRFGGRCAYCGELSEALQIDHVVPLSRGGVNGVGNYLPACPRCNRSKNSSLLSEWRYRPYVRRRLTL